MERIRPGETRRPEELIHICLSLGDRIEDTYPKLAKKEWGRCVLGTRKSRSMIGKATLKIQERTEDFRGHSGGDNVFNALCGRFLGDANPGHPKDR